MKKTSNIFTGLVCLLHLYFMILEMFLWTTPYGQRVFNMTSEVANASAVLAANQGLYNGMLAMGLFFSFFIPDKSHASAIRRYCLFFIIAVGIYGWYSVGIKILFVQAVPALIALITDWLSGPEEQGIKPMESRKSS